MNTLDEQLIDRLRVQLDALTADVPSVPPGLATVSIASVVAMPPRRDRRRALILAAAMIALIAAVAALAAVRNGDDAVGSNDSPPGTTPQVPVVTLATAPLAAHLTPPTPEGWELLEWGNVRLSLPPDMSPFHTGNGCVANAGTDLEIKCGDEFVRIETVSFDTEPAQTINGFHAELGVTECNRCQTLNVFELNAKVTVRWDRDSPLKIIDTVGPSGTWRYGAEIRPTPPPTWKEVAFEGVSIRVPPDWPIQTVSTGETSPCPNTVVANTVLLDLGAPAECDVSSLVAPTDGVRLYLADPPIPTALGWPQQVVASGAGDGAPMVVMRVGYGVDPGIGLAVLSSFTSVSSETSSTYQTVPLTDLPVLAVGESVMLGAAQNLEALGIRTVAEVSKGPDWVLQQLQQAKSQFHVTLGFVLQLGTNGTVTREQYEAILNEVADLPRVVVMTVRGPHPWIAGNNEIIRSLPLTHPNVVVVDWEARSAEVADHLAPDGIHLRDDVAKAFYTDLILEALGLPTS